MAKNEDQAQKPREFQELRSNNLKTSNIDG